MKIIEYLKNKLVTNQVMYYKLGLLFFGTSGSGSSELNCFVLINLLNRQSGMRGQKKKLFIRSIGDPSDSRGSSLAKQAISAICGDTVEKASSSSPSPSPENISPALAPSEPYLSESKIESALGAIEKESELKSRLDDKLRICQERFADLEGQIKHARDVPAKGEGKIETETAVCQCCERTDVKIDQLVKIDSGQQLCSDCLNELRA